MYKKLCLVSVDFITLDVESFPPLLFVLCFGFVCFVVVFFFFTRKTA